MAVDVVEIARRMKAKKKPPGDDEEEGSPAEGDDEESAAPVAAAFGGDDAGGEPEAGAEGDMGDYDSVEDSAVQELMSTKDPKAFKSALRDFVKACIDREEE